MNLKIILFKNCIESLKMEYSKANKTLITTLLEYFKNN